MTTAPRRTRLVAGQTAAWLEAGSGPPLVLVHGAGGSADLWQAQLDGLADAGRLVAPDLPGHGPLGGRGKPSIGAYATWLAGFLAAQDEGRPAVLVGHSMGGAIAQTLALAEPERLAGLVLVSTGARLRVLARLVELLRAQPGEGQRLIRDLSFAPDAPREPVELVERALRDGAPLVTLGDYLACDRFDVRARLAGIRTPTLVVTGAEDRLTPLRYGRYLAERIPGARLAEIAGAGHFPQLEQPARVDAAIREFLADLRGAPTGEPPRPARRQGGVLR
ncbi:MAG TPA: alpha/beta fold hydrolase [Methylomirabilota bacterium]